MNFLYRYRLSATGTGTLGVGPGEVIISFGRAAQNPFSLAVFGLSFFLVFLSGKRERTA